MTHYDLILPTCSYPTSSGTGPAAKLHKLNFPRYPSRILTASKRAAPGLAELKWAQAGFISKTADGLPAQQYRLLFVVKGGDRQWTQPLRPQAGAADGA